MKRITDHDVAQWRMTTSERKNAVKNSWSQLFRIRNGQIIRIKCYICMHTHRHTVFDTQTTCMRNPITQTMCVCVCANEKWCVDRNRNTEERRKKRKAFSSNNILTLCIKFFLIYIHISVNVCLGLLVNSLQNDCTYVIITLCVRARISFYIHKRRMKKKCIRNVFKFLANREKKWFISRTCSPLFLSWLLLLLFANEPKRIPYFPTANDSARLHLHVIEWNTTNTMTKLCTRQWVALPRSHIPNGITSTMCALLAMCLSFGCCCFWIDLSSV